MITNFKKITNTKDKKRLLSNFFSLASMQGINYILPLLTMPYLFRVLGAEKFGLVAFALSTIMFLNVLVEYGFNLSATRDVSTHSNDKQKLIEIYSIVLTIKFLLIIISFLILSFFIIFIKKFSSEWELFYLTFLVVIGNAVFPIWFFQGIEEMKYISILNIIAKVFFTIGIFVFVHSPEDYLYQPLLNGLGFIVVGLYSIYFIKKKYQVYFRLQPISKVVKSIKDGWNVFLIEFMPNMYNNFATFLLGFFTTMEVIGFYSLAINIIDVCNKLIYIMRNVTYPYLNKNFNKFKKIARVMIIIGGLLSFLIYTTSYWTIPFVFGEKAYNSLLYIYILALSPLFLAISAMYGTNNLLIKKQDKRMRDITFKYSLFGFVSAILLVPLFGAIGSATVLFTTRLVMSVLIYREGKKI